MNFTPFVVSFKLAFITTLVLFILVLPVAYALSGSKSRLKPFIESIAALPLVLPPTVMGFYLLFTFSKNSTIGGFLFENFGIELVFSFSGLVFASCIYSLPFMFQPLLSGFESLNKNIIEASYLSGKSKITTLFFIALPNIKPSLITAFVITFAHTVGEFGIVLMVGGSVEGKTKVASIAIYEFSEIMDYSSAHIYSAIMLIISFVVLLSVYFFNQKAKS
ncbi:molybdate ABC transporter permease subunit [Campylobacter sp. RM12327]|uniref:molybdate ABC transporter permease subunit n=1 Tax=Campylobacter sputorum TaxID=206 RepID=UPI000B76ED01|nr:MULTISPECIES: molybdate ABC transporter permease subunit [Campylobacter]MBE7358311.1 molybdate ABC transporter permease subunit [Campylobacter sp. RM11302]MBF6669473.1 molybdate ABC transporter permease subunit [Campylobacter sp. RM12327]MBF6674784.1 molybdate ABC transporter permease subunit [Campylobacter sp. RM13538]MBF6676608.1 molybdate ABC transporter permease subunit [Campylobacter sp. RM12321]MBF6677955.1 molybdate ABC transporter permease subunit [Campylobacter sp. RM11259]